LKWVKEQGHSIGVDPERITYAGDGWGANIAAGIGMLLAESNESDIV
jgi:acetyl esterase/lipase